MAKEKAIIALALASKISIEWVVDKICLLIENSLTGKLTTNKL
jgi:hypothetical protein